MDSFTKKLIIGLILWVTIATYFAISKVQSGHFHPTPHNNPTLSSETPQNLDK